jgi:hypothetical protein
VKEQDEAPDPENAGGAMRGLFDMEQGLERSPSPFRAVIRELLDRIIEKRLEYYIPIEDDEEDAVGSFRGFPHAR